MAAYFGFSIRRSVGAAAISLVANTLVFGRMFGPLLQKPDDVVEMVLDDLPDDRAPDDRSADDPLPPVPLPDPQLDKPQPKDKPKPILAKQPDKPKPEAPKPPEPLAQQQPKPVPPPPAPPPPPPPPVQKEKLKSVEQDQFPDEADNATAHYLAEKNHRVKEDQRSNSTNLVKRVDGQAPPSEQSDNRDDKVGGKEDKIAELQDQPGKPGMNPEAASPGREQAPEVSDKPKSGALSMRNLMPMAEEKRERLRKEGVELNDPDPGNLPRARQGADDKRAAAPRRGVDLRMRVDAKDGDKHDRIIGYDLAAAQRKQGIAAERSMPKGRYDRYLTKLTAMRSAIENFLPEVKPGNQQELGTRASPFAAYIATMHRMIHKHWTFGFLTSLEANWGKSREYEDLTMWTQLEIVLRGDGAVDKVTIVRTSGNLSFDTAAIDSVLSSGPFPTPPPVIRSTNGKVYIDWKFHRDERACGTYGADPHILTLPGQTVEHDTTPIPKNPTAKPE